MSSWFSKIDERREPPGLETALLRRMPLIFVAGTLLPLLTAAAVRLWIDTGKVLLSIDIFLIAATLTFWTAVLTVTIACFIIFVMKGPAYVADAYALNESEVPSR